MGGDIATENDMIAGSERGAVCSGPEVPAVDARVKSVRWLARRTSWAVSAAESRSILADSWTAALQCCTAQHTCHGIGRLSFTCPRFSFWILKTISRRQPRDTKNSAGRAEDTAAERVRDASAGLSSDDGSSVASARVSRGGRV